MNKTININISGLVFTIDEEAYVKLKAYLDSLKSYFAKTEGGDEIVADIESRIAEIFNEYVKNHQQVINTTLVEEVISGLGQAKDMMEDEDEKSEYTSNQESKNANDSKRIYRDRENGILGGVCLGLSYYLGLDVVWVRLIFLLIGLISFGFIILLYVIFWIVIPAANTTTEKLQMKGKPINVSNIEEMIKQSAKDIGKEINEIVNDPKHKIKFKDGVKKAESGIHEIAHTLVRIIKMTVRIVAKFLAVLSIFIGFVIAFALFISFFSSFGIFGFVVNDYIKLFEPNSTYSSFLLISIFLLIFIPVLSLMLKSFQLLLKSKKIEAPIGWIFFSVWIVSLAVFIISASQALLKIKTGTNIEVVEKWPSFPYKRLHISTNDQESQLVKGKNYTYEVYSSDAFFFKNDEFYYKNVILEITRSDDQDFHLIKNIFSKGTDFTDAQKNAEIVHYQPILKDSVLELSSFIHISNGPFRFQEVTLELQVPENGEIIFDNHTWGIENNSLYATGMYSDYPKKLYRMTSSGLSYIPRKGDKHNESNMSLYQITDFNEINIDSERDIKVEITEGNDYKVLVSNSLANNKGFKISESGYELEIEIDDNFFEEVSDEVSIKIEMPSIDGVHCSGRGTVYIKNNQSNSLELSGSGLTQLYFDGFCDQMELDLSGLSSVQFTGGIIKNLYADISGKSSIKALEILMENADIDMSGVTIAQMNVSDNLNLDISGSSTLYYKGNPLLVQNVSGVSKVEKILD